MPSKASGTHIYLAARHLTGTQSHVESDLTGRRGGRIDLAAETRLKETTSGEFRVKKGFYKASIMYIDLL